MVMAADKENRKQASAIILSAAATSFLTGITEPIEFTFLFLAPWLFFGPHAIMAGMSFMFADLMGANMGMTFSGGAIDYVIYGIIPDAMGREVSCWVPIVVGVAYVPIYYFGFYFLITKFNIETPGRGSNIEDGMKLYSKADVKAQEAGKKGRKIGTAELKAPAVLETLGGKKNIKDINACITKLRVTVIDKTKVDEEGIKKLGAKGVIWISKDHVHALFGAEADPLKTQISKLLTREDTEETKPVVKAEAKTSDKADTKSEAKSEAKPSVKKTTAAKKPAAKTTAAKKPAAKTGTKSSVKKDSPSEKK